MRLVDLVVTLALPRMVASWKNLVEIEDPQSFAALMYAPPGGVGSDGWPLLLYLHGAGESGQDVRELISEGATGTPPVSLERGTAIPELAENFVVVAPQTSFGWSPDDVVRFLDFVIKSHDVPPLDPSRLYVTGHSMGGSGALHAATTKRFAACVPVAPAGSARPDALRGTPVWAFHGANDVIIPSDVSERLVAALRRAGAPDDDARLTVYDNAPTPRGWPSSVGHASTIPAYSTPDLYAWLLSHSLRRRAAPSSETVTD